MDNQTKLLLSKASLELHYEGKSTYVAYKEVNEMIEYAYGTGKITRRERNELMQMNEDVYMEFNKG